MVFGSGQSPESKALVVEEVDSTPRICHHSFLIFFFHRGNYQDAIDKHEKFSLDLVSGLLMSGIIVVDLVRRGPLDV
jgi:hypothetical protein